MARAVSGCEVWQQDLLAMTLPPARFDGVFANAVLFHVPSRALPGVLDRLHAASSRAACCSSPTRVGRTKRASSTAVTPASTASRPGAGWSATAASPWSTIISARPASPAASSRGSPRSGASRHRQIGSALAEGATDGANCEPGLRPVASEISRCAPPYPSGRWKDPRFQSVSGHDRQMEKVSPSFSPDDMGCSDLKARIKTARSGEWAGCRARTIQT